MALASSVKFLVMTASRSACRACGARSVDGRGEVRFRSDVTVELVKHAASDADVLWAARVSTKGEQSLAEVEADPGRSQGLINFLMRDWRPGGRA
jgi:hypothetical protein